MSTFRCAIFAAVSTPGQAAADKGSIADQIAKARETIQARGWHEVAVYTVPGQSRSITFLHDAMADIPAFDDMVKAARRQEFDLLVCLSFDRLARTSSLLAQLQDYLGQCGVQLYSLAMPVEPVPPGTVGDASGSSRIISSVGGALAEEEKRRFVARSRAGKRAKARRGLYLTKAPFGYKPLGGGLLAPDPERAPVVQRMFADYLAGYGLTPIAARLNSDGNRTAQGRMWCAASIHAILSNPAYGGQVRYGYKLRTHSVNPDTGEAVVKAVPCLDPVLAQAQFEPIIAPEQWAAVQAERARRSGMTPRNGATRGIVHPLSGLMRCAYCGGRMHIHYAGSGRGDGRYVCTRHVNTGACQLNSIGERVAERAVLDRLTRVTADPSTLEDALSRAPAAPDETPALEAALSDLSTRRRRLLDAYEAGMLALPVYGERDRELAAQEQEAAQRLARARDTQAQALSRHERKAALLKLAGVNWYGLGRLELKAACRAFLSAVVVREHRVVDVSFA